MLTREKIPTRWLFLATTLVAVACASAFLLREAVYFNPIGFPPYGYDMSGVPGLSKSVRWPPWPWVAARFAMYLIGYFATTKLFLTQRNENSDSSVLVRGPLLTIALACAFLVLSAGAILIELLGLYDQMIVSIVGNLGTVYVRLRDAPFWILLPTFTAIFYVLLCAWYRYPAEHYMRWTIVVRLMIASLFWLVVSAALLSLSFSEIQASWHSTKGWDGGVAQLSGYYPAIIWSAHVLFGTLLCATVMFFVRKDKRHPQLQMTCCRCSQPYGAKAMMHCVIKCPSCGCYTLRNKPFQVSLAQSLAVLAVVAIAAGAMTITWRMWW